MRDERVWRILIVVVFTAVYALFINSRAFSANDWSRMGAIESLVERGTWRLDESAFVKTVDKIQVDGSFYSDKPPTQAFVGAGVYAVLHYGFGIELQAQGCEPDFDSSGCLALWEIESADWGYYALVLLLVSLPAAGMLAMLFESTQKSGWSVWMGMLLVVSLGLGTAVWPYSTIFINHVPAAVCLFAAVYLLLQEQTAWRVGWVGFLATFAATLDLSAAVYLVAIGVYLLLYQRKSLGYFVLGCLPPGVLAVGLNYMIVGNPFPPQLYTAGYDYAGSSFGDSVAGNQTADSPLLYTHRMLFGDRGVFAFYPVVLVYVMGVVTLLRTAEERVRRIGWLVLLGTAGYLSYFVLLTDNFGGVAFGVRWLLNPLPLLALLASTVQGWQRPPRWLPVSLVVLLIPSVWMGYRGALAPWQPDVPIMQLMLTPPQPREQVHMVISGYESLDEIDSAILDSFGLNHQERRWFDATQSFVVPQGEAWWFVDGRRTPPGEPFAQRFGLGSAVDYSLKADLTPAAEEWIGEMVQTVYQDELLVPEGAAAETVSLPQTFLHPQGDMQLRGVEVVVEGGEVTVLTAWQVLGRQVPTGERRIFMHLLNENGEIVAQSDAFAVLYEQLRVGDLYFQQQSLVVEGVPVGAYWIQTGVYVPASGMRLPVNGRDRLLIARIGFE